MVNKLKIGATIGIIGAGQLGKMLAQSAQKMGFKVAMFDPNPSSCGFNVSHSHTIAAFDDREKLLEFVKSVDVVTYEFENINGELLQELESVSYLPQGTDLLLNSQNRIKEKTWLNSHDILTADFVEIKEFSNLVEAAQKLTLPAILKTTRFGYDGKGQILLKDLSDLDLHKEEIEGLLSQQTLVLEAFCDFEFEASVMVSRDLYDTVNVFPISRNQHIHGVLYSSLVGVEYSNALKEEIQTIAEKIAREGNLIGVCGIEFFITETGRVLVNEIAPRPHNSGHYTMEATNVSQYDQHILAITGRPLVQSRLMEPALMINILGQHLPLIDAVSKEYPDAIYHLYDKGEAKEQRKMGHFTITDPDYNKLDRILNQSETLEIWRNLF